MGISPLGLPGQWTPQASVRYNGIAAKASLIPTVSSPAYQVIQQQALGALGGSRGYQAYVQSLAQAQRSEAEAAAAEEAEASSAAKPKPAPRENITDKLLAEAGWKMPEDPYAKYKVVDLNA